MNSNTHKAQARAKKNNELTSSTSHVALLPAEVERPLTEEEEQTLVTVAAELKRLDRKTTAQTFECGKHFGAAKAILSRKAFGKWLKTHTSYSVRHAWNYIAVDKQLGWHRKRCEDAAIPPSSLFILATAEDEGVIEDVLASFERGERPTGARIKNMIALARSEPIVETEPMNAGGFKGFLKAAEMRNKADGARFDALAHLVLEAVEAAAVRIEQGEHVTKKGLSDAVQYDARHMHDLLKTMLGPITGNDKHPYINWTPGSIAGNTAWGAAQVVLERLGGADNWPSREEFPDWLTRTVLPVLRFVARGEELPGFEVQRVIERASAEGDLASDEGADLNESTVVAIGIERQKHQGSDAEAA